MRKLTNKKIKWIIRQLDKDTSIREIAAVIKSNAEKDLSTEKAVRRNRRNS